MSRKLAGVVGWSVLGIVVVMVLAVAGGIAAGWFVAHGSISRDQAVLAVITPLAVVSMIGALLVGFAWMRSIDEAAREAHKAAWYWGGTAGMAVGGVALIIASTPGIEAPVISVLPGRTDPAAYAFTGAVGMMVLMIIGYTIAWAWWWWARRQ